MIPTKFIKLPNGVEVTLFNDGTVTLVNSSGTIKTTLQAIKPAKRKQLGLE